MLEKWYNLTHQGAFVPIANEFQWKIREFSHNPNAYEVEYTTNCRVITSYCELEERQREKRHEENLFMEFITRSHSRFNCFENLKKSLTLSDSVSVLRLCFMILLLVLVMPKETDKKLENDTPGLLLLQTSFWNVKNWKSQDGKWKQIFPKNFFFQNNTPFLMCHWYELCNRLWRMHFRNHSINARVNWENHWK